jgi:hypothetical protein
MRCYRVIPIPEPTKRPKQQIRDHNPALTPAVRHEAAVATQAPEEPGRVGNLCPFAPSSVILPKAPSDEVGTTRVAW